MKIRIITASAGTGKTFRLTKELDDAIASGRARPEGIVATTFTKQAAAELIERARTRLLQGGRGREAHQLLASRIGTVNSICGSFVSDFAFELGMSPELRVLDEATSELEFRRALARVVTADLADDLETLTARFDQDFDWRHEVRRIVEAARANGLSAADLPACGDRSIRDLDACMGACETARDLDRELADALARTITSITTGEDLTKGTADYVELLRSSARDVARGTLVWGGWAKLASSKPTKKSVEHAVAVQRIAAQHVAHPRLRKQMHDLIGILFRVAADGLTAYQSYKRERGVIDFVDQETLALEVLRRSDVRAAIAGQIDLVLVDEFQDTSPIQLAVFLELAALATESVWVGDPKQAIYGFRGTDPGLMDAAIESLTSTKTDADLVDQAAEAVTRGKVETLDISYRSRPALVAVTSEIFARAFSRQGMPEDRTRLKPVLEKEPDGLGSVLEYWPLDLEQKNADARAQALAAGVRQLFERDVKVRGPDAVRNVRRSDVAVLCRTNAQCQAVADALAALGVPAVVPRMRLFDTTEGMVLLAGLRLWVDPDDALAAAELARLISHPEGLDDVVARALAAPGREAFRDDPTVARIVAAREKGSDRDLLSVVEAICEATELRTLCAAWGDSSQRLANLDALRSHAVAYVDESLASGDAATLVGLIRRFAEIGDDFAWDKTRSDSQALLSGEEAVTVSTWHRAKGLEWPVTILYGLESLRDPQAHGVHVMSDRVVFEVKDPLGGRWIRFWPNPYINTQQKGAVRDAYERSPAHATLVARTEREALRVLYVGWTRARDRLVLAAQRGKLLDGIVGKLSAIDRTLISEPAAAGLGVEPIAWAGVHGSINSVPSQPAPPVIARREPGTVTTGLLRQAFPAARTSPSGVEKLPCSIGEVVELGPRIVVTGRPDMEAVGHAMHGFLAADRPGIPDGERLEMATNLLQRFGVAESVVASDVLIVANRFRGWLDSRFMGARIHREHPVLHRTESGTIVAGIADLIVRQGQQAVVIDHKSFPGLEAAALVRAQDFSGQLASYAEAIRSALDDVEVKTWIHFPLVGKLVEIRLDPRTEPHILPPGDPGDSIARSEGDLMTFKRRVLSALSKTELLEVGRAVELQGLSRLTIDGLRDALASSKQARLDRIVTAALSLDTLTEICEACGLDATGKKTLLVERILGAANGELKTVGLATGAREKATPVGLVTGAREKAAPYVSAQGEQRLTSASVSERTGADVEHEDDEPIGRYEHKDKLRANNPPVGLVSPQTDRDGQKKTYSYDPHLDPSLGWAGKTEHVSFDVDTVSLHVHERIDPMSIVAAVRKGGAEPVGQPQLSLFDRPKSNPPLRQAVEFYKHPHEWSNRLIAGDSVLVMNSLLEKEGLGGQVQMIYIDPPYGIEYGSNFQPFVNRREVKDGADDDLTQEPETIRAFRDTWELGIHSYLTYLRDRLLLSRALLHESGSCFVQISDENLHLVRNLMDEVFGVGCFVVTFPVKKKGSQKSSLVDPVNDYVVWYGRSTRASGKIKYRPLFVPRALDADTLAEFKFVELDRGVFQINEVPDSGGKARDYRLSPKQLFKDYPEARLFRSNPMTSGGDRKNQSLPYKVNGKVYNPGAGKCWKTTVQTEDGAVPGMDRLAAAGRLLAGDGQLRFKSYLDDFGYEPLSNWWDGLGGASNPVYVVQTNPEIIQRCMLMTTDPGDLVLDPTSGSGTTAYVAEQWGRRWIATDTSRVAITLARQRLMTATYDYYKLRHPKEGVGAGFEYNTVPHITLGAIANNPEIKPGISKKDAAIAIAKYAPQEIIFDDPQIESGKTRVTGPFTVEAVPSPVVRSPSDLDAGQSMDAAETSIAQDTSVARQGETLRQAEWRDELKRAGIRGKNKQLIGFTRIEPLAGTKWLHADGETNANGGAKPQRVVVSFGSEYAPLEQRQVELALEEASHLFPKPGLVVFASFQFDPEAAKDIDETNPETLGMQLLKVQMNTDLLTEDLKKKRSSNESFWLMGQPDVRIKKVKGGEVQLEVLGFDYYNPREGKLESGGPANIAVWMLDPDYDGRSLYPRQVFFPMASDKEGWSRLAKTLKAEIDHEKIEAYRGSVSLPFKPGRFRRVAVKIVDDRGIESLRIVPL